MMFAKWPSYFKHKVIAECQSLPSNLYVEELRAAFDTEADDWGKYVFSVSKIHSVACFNKSNMQ